MVKKKIRPTGAIREMAECQGWRFTKAVPGGQYIHIDFPREEWQIVGSVLFNMETGHFFGRISPTGEKFDSEHLRYEDHIWFKDLLKLFFEEE